MSEVVDELRRMSEAAIAHDEALVRSLKEQIAYFRIADHLLELSWMWPKQRVDQAKLEQDVWNYFAARVPGAPPVPQEEAK